VQAVAWLARLAVADAVGQHDEVFARVERLPRAKQFAGEIRSDELGGRCQSCRGVIRHGVANHALGVAHRLADGPGSGFAIPAAISPEANLKSRII